MNKLDKKINKYLFTIRTIFSLFIYAYFVFSLVALINSLYLPIINYLLLITSSLLLIIVIPFHLIVPFFSFKYYSYLITDKEICINKGVLFKRSSVIPIKRIEHVETIEGPIQMLFNLKQVNIYTSGSFDAIIGLNKWVAEDVLKEISSKLIEHLDIIKDKKDE